MSFYANTEFTLICEHSYTHIHTLSAAAPEGNEPWGSEDHAMKGK